MWKRSFQAPCGHPRSCGCHRCGIFHSASRDVDEGDRERKRAPSPLRINLTHRSHGLAWTFERRRCFGPTSHTQMSSEWDHSGLYYRACADRSHVRVPRKDGACRTTQAVAAYIGLDWGDQQHAVAVQPATGGRVEHSELAQRPETVHAWVAQLRRRFGGRPVGIAVEQRRGAVMHALMMYEFLVLYPINPKALARYREALHPSGAKDDPTDAALPPGSAARASRPAAPLGARHRGSAHAATAL